MTYCRIKLSKTNYQAYDYAYIDDKPNLKQLQKIYNIVNIKNLKV